MSTTPKRHTAAFSVDFAAIEATEPVFVSPEQLAELGRAAERMVSSLNAASKALERKLPELMIHFEPSSEKMVPKKVGQHDFLVGHSSRKRSA